ncbi:PP2C family protein-serine/threonine phosphatase, partial [Georgenia sp.]
MGGTSRNDGAGRNDGACRIDCADAVLQSLPDAVAVLTPGPDRAWELVTANAAMRELLGLHQALDARPGRVAERGGPELDADSRRSIRHALARDEPATIVVQARRGDGVPFWAQLDLVPLDVPAGDAPLWSVVARDISDQIERASLERVQREVERRARLGLTIVSRTSDLLQEGEPSEVLRAIADLLSRRAVAWAGFVVEDRNLREVDGIDPLPRRPPAQRPPGADEVERLLGGVTMYTVHLDAPATPGSATAEVLAIVEPHRARHPDADREVLVLPVLGRVRTLGLLVVLPYVEEVLPDGEPSATIRPRDELVTMLELVARRVGMAMDNARLYASEHQLAEALQRAMLPEQAEVVGLDVWTYYAPSASHAQVGGDWYDVVNLRDETVAVVIGDVVGHDVEAAATMGQLRSVVRAFAVELVDPGIVLGRVDDLVDTMRMPRSASLVYATLTPRHGVWDLTYSRA